MTVRGRRWDPETTVTVGFDASAQFASEDLDGTTPTSLEDSALSQSGPGGGGDDDDTTSTSLDEDTTTPTVEENATLVSDDVTERGRFRVEFTIPSNALRGSHSLNVDGTDRDGLPVQCATTVTLDEQPTGTTSDTTPDTTDTTEDTTGTTEPTTNGTTGTTESSTP